MLVIVHDRLPDHLSLAGGVALLDWQGVNVSYEIPPVAEKMPPGGYVYPGTYNVLNDRAIEVRATDQSKDVALVDLSYHTSSKYFHNGTNFIILPLTRSSPS